jgi:hypothetical protein
VWHTDSALKKASFFEPLFTGGREGRKEKGMRSHRSRGGAGRPDAGQCQAREPLRWRAVRLARPPAGRTSEVGGTLGARVSELGAVRLAGAKRGKDVPRRSVGVSGAEQGRPAAERSPSLWTTTLLRMGNVFGRDERLITCGERDVMIAVFCLPRAEDGHRVGLVSFGRRVR